MLTLASEISSPRHDAHPPQDWPMISGLVHDLRQPLSVIDACADYLNLVLPDTDERAREQLDLLQQQVGEANRILHEALLNAHYSDAAAEPAGEPTASSLPLTKAASAGVTY